MMKGGENEESGGCGEKSGRNWSFQVLKLGAFVEEGSTETVMRSGMG